MVDYLSILVFLAIIGGFGAFTVTASHILGKHHATYFKELPYECGLDPEGEAQTRFEPKFYLVCLIFLLFDIELVFLYLWGIVARDLGYGGFIETIIFIIILVLGYFYGWKHRAFDWASDGGATQK